MDNDVVETTPTMDENRSSGFHIIKIKSENSKNIWSLYETDFKEMLKLCKSEHKRIQFYASIYSFFGRFSYLIISLASLLNSGLAMWEEYKYILIGITYLITFISIVNTSFNFEKKAEDFYFISKEYENIGYKIKHLLYNCDVSEKDPEQWYDIINNEIDQLDTFYFTNMNRVKKSLKDSDSFRRTKL